MFRKPSSFLKSLYTRPLDRAGNEELYGSLSNPPHDLTTYLLDNQSSIQYRKPRPSLEWYVHLEVGVSGSTEEHSRAKTKWGGYCFNAQSFLNIVTEEVGI